MTTLEQSTCETCKTGGSPLTPDECRTLLLQLQGWQIDPQSGIDQLNKVYLFADFSQALAFTNQIGRIAEEQNHHPALLTEWGKVTVRWWSHSISGLHRNDFIMAARTDQVSRECAGLKSA